MLETESNVGAVTIVTAGHTLALATAERRAKPTSPEYLSEFENALWSLNRFAMGLSSKDVEVTECPWGEDEIGKFMGIGRFRRVAKSDLGLFLPEVASTIPEGLLLLDKAYPSMGWEAQNIAASVRNVDEEGNVINLFGWLRTEKSIDAPYTGTAETKAKEIISGKNRVGTTLNVYGAAGQESKLLSKNCQYLDEVKTWARVLSSRGDGRVVSAYFDPDGYCRIYWFLGPGDVNDVLGVRSVTVSGNFRRHFHLEDASFFMVN